MQSDMIVIDTLSQEMSGRMQQAVTRVSELNDVAAGLSKLVTGEARLSGATMADVILFFGSNADTMIATKALKDADRRQDDSETRERHARRPTCA